MRRKTALRNLLKYAPLSAEVMKAAVADEQSGRDLAREILDVESTVHVCEHDFHVEPRGEDECCPDCGAVGELKAREPGEEG